MPLPSHCLTTLHPLSLNAQERLGYDPTERAPPVVHRPFMTSMPQNTKEINANAREMWNFFGDKPSHRDRLASVTLTTPPSCCPLTLLLLPPSSRLCPTATAPCPVLPSVTTLNNISLTPPGT